jgi:SAM-dependent methyltransferase
MSQGDATKPNAMERRRWNDAYWTATWPAREALTGSVTAGLLERLGLRDGERVLDVGSGAGTTTIAVARAVAPSGSVVGADLSAPLVDLATHAATRERVDNVRFVVVDVQTDPLPGGPFTVAMSQFGVMFFEEPVTALANVRAHVDGDGRLAFACWQPAAKNPWYLGHALAGLLPAPAPPAPCAHATGPFAFGDPTDVEGLLAAAGWGSIEVEGVETSTVVAREVIAEDGQAAFLGVPASRLGEASAAIDRHLAGFDVVDGRFRVPIAYFYVTASAAG